jgi:hypothetical protein
VRKDITDMPSEESSALYNAKATGYEVSPWPAIIENVRIVNFLLYFN